MTAQRLTELRAAAWLWRRELGVAAACVAAFTIVAVLTTLPAVAGWDARVTAAVNTVVAADTSLRFAAVAVTTLGSPVSIDVLTVVAVVVAWRRRDGPAGRVRATVYLTGTRLVELGVETGVKHLVDRPRPLVAHPLATAADASFPSGHTAGTAVLCVAVLLLARTRSRRPVRLRQAIAAVGVVMVIVAAVAASRVLLGLHYPTDVLGGALLGVATALALTPVLTSVEAHGP